MADGPSRVRRATVVAAVIGALGAGLVQPAYADLEIGTVNLTRVYRGNDGSLLYTRAVGSKVVGFGEKPSAGLAFAFDGVRSATTIAGRWWDLPEGKRTESGTLTITFGNAGAALTRVSGNDPGPDSWTAIPKGDATNYSGIRPQAGFQSTRTDDLDGAWDLEDGGRAYTRESPTGDVVWVAEQGYASGGLPTYSTLFVGKRTVSGTVVGSFYDLPIGSRLAHGTFHANVSGYRLMDAHMYDLQGNDFFGKDYFGGAVRYKPDYAVDHNRFGNEIEKRLDSNVVGYSYGIARAGTVVKSDGNGWRRLAVDGGPLPFDRDTMAQAASTSKTITAAAMLKALNARGISVDSPVEPYLPECWNRPAPGSKNSVGQDLSIEGLTFRALLGHDSRFTREGDSLASLREMIKEGRNGTQFNDYLNNNYSLMRVLVPFVLSRAEMQSAFNEDSCLDSGVSPDPAESVYGGKLNKLVSDRFRDYVMDEILAPVGASASFYPAGDGSTNWSRNYHNVKRTMPGNPPKANAHLLGGAGRLAIGAVDYARFLSALDAGTILPHEPTSLISIEDMIGTPGNRMGFDGSVTGKLDALHTYIFKNGICPDDDGTTTGCKAVAFMLPKGIQAWVVVNSSANTYTDGSIQDLVRNAFDAAVI